MAAGLSPSIRLVGEPIRGEGERRGGSSAGRVNRSVLIGGDESVLVAELKGLVKNVNSAALW